MSTEIFSHKRAETAMEQEERAKAQEAPHRTGQDLTACGGLKPISVNHYIERIAQVGPKCAINIHNMVAGMRRWVRMIAAYIDKAGVVVEF